MKKSIFLFFAALLFSASAWADWCGNSFITVNGLWCTGSNSYVHDGGKFHGKDLGTLTTLELGGEFQVWPSSTTAGTLCYKIDDGTENSIPLPKTGTEGNNSKHSGSGAVDLSGLAGGSHSIAVWFKHGSDIDNNGGSNFVATFTIAAATPEPEPEPEPVADVTVHFINSVKWDAVACYHWGEGGAGTEWPGDVLSKTDEIVGYDVYTATFTGEHTSCIFNNNNNGKQTGTLDVKNGQYYDLKSDTWYASLADVPAPDPLATDVFLAGSMNEWSTTANEFKKVEEGSATATLTMNLEAGTVYEFKVVREGAWTSRKDQDDDMTITETIEGLQFSSSSSKNCKMKTNLAGSYIFTWEISTSKLSITYPASTEPEPTELTYNVTVPAGTKACYICGNMTGWNFTEMTKVDDTHYTITIEGAKISDGYKYASGAEWGYVEKDANGNEIGDRTYVDGNDVVARWASVYDPDAVEQELTYSVTVPEGTYACYIAMDTDPAQDGWEFNEMTKVDDTHYTFTRTGLKSKTYKYASGAGWEYVEKTDEDGEVADRTWAENDVVAKWASVYNPSAPTYDYYVIGTVNNWGLKDENFGMTDEDADGVYEKEVTLTANNKHGLKINNGSWDDNTQIFGFDQLNVAYEGVSRGSGDGDNNVVIELTEDKTITVKFDKNAGKITLDGLTEVETETLVYTVEVPEGTEDCYIAGQMNNWEFERMTQVNATQWTITYDNVLKTTEYKYACQASWDYKELDKEGKEVANRTWTELDKVEKWAEPAEVKCYLMGNGDWVNGVEMEEDGAQFKLLAHHIYAPFKFKFGETWTADVENTDFEGLGSEDDGNGGTNITLPEGLYDFYFKKDTKKVYIALVGYARNVTNKYGTICLPYASASTSGATFFEVVGQEAGNVYLASVTELKAGVPYIFEKSANQIKVVYTGEKETTAGSANGLVGTFADNTTVPNDAYILYGGEFCPNNDPTKPNKINAYRAYLDLSDVDGGKPNQMPGRRYIGMSVQGENGATGVEDIFSTDAPVKVIENGQLIIIRDGVKYNVQGQKL